MNKAFIISNFVKNIVKKIKQKKIFFSLIIFIIVILISYCTIKIEKTIKSDMSSNSNNYNNLNENNISNNELGELENNIPNNELDGLFGYWRVKKVAFWEDNWALRGSRLSGGRREDYIGKILEYRNDYIKISDNIYNNPSYQTSFKNIDIIENITDFIYQHYSYSFHDYVNSQNLEDKIGVNIDIETKDSFPIGRNIFLIDESNLLVDTEGFYLIAEKVNPQALKPEDIPKPEYPIPYHLLGKWKIIDSMNFKSDRVSYENFNKIIEYASEYINIDGVVYKNPIYSYDVKVPDDNFAKMNYTSKFEYECNEKFKLYKNL